MRTGEGSELSRWWLAAALILPLLYLLRFILLPFAVAAALAYVAAPMVGWLQQRWRFPRWLAALSVYAAILCLLGAFGFWVRRVLVPEFVGLAHHAPQILHRTLTEIFGDAVSLFGQHISTDDLTRRLLARSEQLLLMPEQTVPILLAGFGFLIGGFLTLVLLFYFLLGGERLVQGVLWLVPVDHQARARRLVSRIDPMLGRYIRGIALIVLYASLMTWLGIGLLFRWPHAVPLAIATGLLELIPILGPAASATMLGVVAIQQEDLKVAIGFAVFAVVLRLSIDQIVGPLVLGRAALIHPVVVIFAFLVGGTLFGILGVILAVPVAATIKIVVQEIREENDEL